MKPVAEQHIQLDDAAATADLAHRLAPHLHAGDVLILTGELGAGKTTFTQALGRALGVDQPMTSPTFVLARNHPNPVGPNVVHVDAYRLSTADELTSLDLDSSLPESITIVEWGRGLAEGLAGDGPEASWLDIELIRPGAETSSTEAARTETGIITDFSDDEDEPRTCTIRAYGPRFEALADLSARS